jgi:hypothetical protein
MVATQLPPMRISYEPACVKYLTLQKQQQTNSADSRKWDAGSAAQNSATLKPGYLPRQGLITTALNNLQVPNLNAAAVR